ncbi:hypothetical protein [Luteibacter sp. Lutesp34]|uniref:hypothetical protein n=1 Tax=Luteibacter sp. Lutesp34 TaxID=3243030 RepID=UPI0039B50E32
MGLAATLNAEAASCTYEHAHYTYTSDHAFTASFVKLPSTVDYMGDLGMVLDVRGSHAYALVIDGGSRFTRLAIPVPLTGPDAWTIEEGKPGVPGLREMDFHQWSGDRLLDTIPKTGAQAPEVLFMPALDESLRHNSTAPIKPPPGFFRLSRCG